MECSIDKGPAFDRDKIQRFTRKHTRYMTATIRPRDCHTHVLDIIKNRDYIKLVKDWRTSNYIKVEINRQDF